MNWNGIARVCRRALIRTIGVILVVGLTAFLYLSIHGVPKHYVDHWLDQLRSQGYCITVERIRLDLMEGIVAEQFRAFEDEDQLLPILQTDRVTLFLNPLDWLQHRTGLRRLRVSNGLLRLSLVENAAFDDTDAVVVRNVNGIVRFGDDAWQIDDLSADLLGLKISCGGLIRIPRTPGAHENQNVRIQRSEPQSAESNLTSDLLPETDRHKNTVTHQLNALTRSQRERILELVKQLNALTFSIPPHADIALEIDMENPEASEASIRMEGAATRAFGVRFEQWRLQASLKDGRLCLSDANIRQHDQSLTISGSYTFTNRVMDARLSGQILLKDWLIMAPPAWRQALSGAGCAINGPIQCDLQVDPAPIEQALDSLHGWIALAQADMHGIQIERGFVKFVIDDHQVLVDPFYVVLGQGRQRGTLEGYVNYHLDFGDYEGRLESTVDPRTLLPVLSSNQADWIRSLESHDKPLFVELDFSGQADRDDALWISGYVQGSNVSYQAVPVISFKSRIGYANGLLTCDGLRVIRPEGEVTGRFSDDLDGTVLEMDLVSTANPLAIARLIGPNIAAYLDGFHFAGPIRIAARGRIDYGTGALTDIRAEIDGAHWGYAPLHATRCSLNVAVNQLRFDLTNIRGEAYEGTFSGKASFYPAGAATNFWYNLHARVDDINLNTLLQSMGYQGKEEYEGIIYSECALAGAIGKGRGDTATGGGWIRIQDGQLYHLRLLGGFSRLVSIIDPVLGNVNLTDFGANFTVKDRKIDTRDAILSGHTLAIHGEGYYAFDEKLDFIVWAQAHERQTLLPRLTQATAPVLTKLLAVRLTGTVSDPKWWPLNLTKDQLLALPKDLLITMPKDVLIGLPKDLLVNLPKEVLVTLPHDLLITLPKEILIDLPEEIFIKLPQEIWNMLKHLRPAKSKDSGS